MSGVLLGRVWDLNAREADEIPGNLPFFLPRMKNRREKYLFHGVEQLEIAPV